MYDKQVNNLINKTNKKKKKKKNNNNNKNTVDK